MSEIPSAMVKDLLGTGYFFEELKKYSKSTEIDLFSYNKEYAVPYLTKISEGYDRSGLINKSRILNFAIKYLSDVNHDDLADSIFGLKKVASSEIDVSGKALGQGDQSDRAEVLFFRQKSESAELLAKLLVSIIRAFRLSDMTHKLKKSDEVPEGIGHAIKENWALSAISAV